MGSAKKRKSQAKDLNQELADQLVAFTLDRFFVRELPFAPTYTTWIYRKLKGGRWRWDRTEKKRNWRADFACIEARLLIEVDGSTFTTGGHSRGAPVENQNLRTAEANANGWEIMRVTRHMILDGVAIDLIMRALKRRLPDENRDSRDNRTAEAARPPAQNAAGRNQA